MTVTLTINGQSIEAASGRSLFEHAETLEIDVPTSCRKQGKCKECMVEVVDGMHLLSQRAEPEKHLKCFTNGRMVLPVLVVGDCNFWLGWG